MKKFVKTIITAVTSIIILCSIQSTSVYAATVTVNYGSSSYSKESGETFPIGVYVKSDSVIGVHALRLKYDNKRLQYVDGATKEANGVILLKGQGGTNTTVKYWLQFKAISGGTASLTTDVAKVYVNNNTELVNVTTLPSVPIYITGKDITNGISDFMAAQTASPEDGADLSNTDGTQSNDLHNNSLNNVGDSDVTDETIVVDNDVNDEDIDQELEDNDEEVLTDSSVENDSKKEKKEKNFFVSVLVNLLIFGGLTALGILITNAILGKIRRKTRFEQEFEDEYTGYHSALQDNRLYREEYMGDEHMRPIPMDEFSDREYMPQGSFNNNMMYQDNYGYNGMYDDAVKYDQGQEEDMLRSLDVEFVCHDSSAERMQGYQSNSEFDYIEQNLERSLEQQIRDQMNNMQ